MGRPSSQPRMSAVEPKTGSLTKKTLVAIPLGVVVATGLAFGGWVHERIVALETAQIKRDVADGYIRDRLEELLQEVRETRQRAVMVGSASLQHP